MFIFHSPLDSGTSFVSMHLLNLSFLSCETGLLEGWSELTDIKYLAQCLVQSKSSIHASYYYYFLQASYVPGYLSRPQFLHLQNEDNKSSYFRSYVKII